MKPLSILLGAAVIGGTGLFGYGSGMFNQTSGTLDASSMVASSELPARAPETPFASSNTGSDSESVPVSDALESAFKTPAIENPAVENGMSEGSTDSSSMDRVFAKKPALTETKSDVTFNNVSSSAAIEPTKTTMQDVQEKKAIAPDKNKGKKRVPLMPVPSSKPSVTKPSTAQPSVRQPSTKQPAQRPSGVKESGIGKTTGEPEKFENKNANPNKNANRITRPRKDRDIVPNNQRPSATRPENSLNRRPEAGPKTNQKLPARRGDARGPQLADVPPLQAPDGSGDRAVANRQRPNQDRLNNPAQRGNAEVQRRPAQPDRDVQRPASPDVQRQRPNSNSGSRQPRNNKRFKGIQSIQEDNADHLEVNGNRNRGLGADKLTPPPLEIPTDQPAFRGRGNQRQGNNRRAQPPQREQGPGVAMDVTEMPRNGSARNNRSQKPNANRRNGDSIQPLDSSATPQDNNTDRAPKRGSAPKSDKKVEPATSDSDVKSKKEAYEDEMETLREKFDRLKREYDALTGKK